MSEALTSYDRIPYRSHPYRQSHPDRMGTIARLFGLVAPPIENCRVLELGCAGGGNVIPMAEQFPDSEFIGIDASSRQIAEGRRQIDELGMKNIRLSAEDILKFQVEPGSFDYILSHGVYSWVPNPVQDRILEIVRTGLKPQGVAYISYNTHPGWRMRGMIRDIMRYRARSFESPQVQLSQARNLLEFLYTSVKGDDTAYSMLLKTELASMSKSEDYYLMHEQLEEINDPLYFHQFIERAAHADLQYLGESDFGTMTLENFPEEVRNMLNSVSRDVIEVEQYMDFLRNRAFRQTLLCHREAQLERPAHPSKIQGLRVASNTRPEGEVNLNSEEKTTFRRGGSVLTTNNPYVKATMTHLASVWLRSVPFVELASIGRSMVEGRPGAIGSDVMSRGTQQLAETILRCFSTGQIDLHVSEVPISTSVSSTPAATPYARLQARDSTMVTNRLHETVPLDDLQRFVLCSLDGTRDRAGSAEFVGESVSQGKLILYHQGSRITDAAQAREMVSDLLPEILEGFARSALLVE